MQKQHSFLQFIRLLIAFSLMALLSSCAMFQGKFECSEVSGVKGCVSMSEIEQNANKLIEQQGTPRQVNNLSTIKKTSQSMPYFTGTNIAIPQIGQPVRVGDTVQKVMVFDYIDTDGNYHEPSIVYTILETSKWLNHSVLAIQTLEHE